MKSLNRRYSILLSIFTFTAVLAISLLSIVQIKHTLAPFTDKVAALPVIKSKNINNQPDQLTSFAVAKTYFSHHGIELSNKPITKVPGASYEIYSDTSDEIVLSAQALQQEYTKYSDATLRSSGLKKIYLVKNLVVDGQARSGMPEPRLEDALYFDVSIKYLGSENGNYTRRTFHHEFNHLIIYNQNGMFSPTDKSWLACNDANFRYGSGGPSMYNTPEYAHIIHPQFAFTDGYATSGIEEDKAEVFADYMTNPGKLQLLSGKDSGVACKLANTEKFLQNLH